MHITNLPKDPVMLLSVINTKLRDQYSSLELLCEDLGVSGDELNNILNTIDYFYDVNQNQYI